MDAITDIIRARASFGPGEVPDEYVTRARNAERDFAAAARDDLTMSGAVARPQAPRSLPSLRLRSKGPRRRQHPAAAQPPRPSSNDLSADGSSQPG